MGKIVGIIIVALVGVVVFCVVKGRRNTVAQAREFSSTADMMEYFCSEAVSLAHEQFKRRLDFSVRSIEEVEEILGEIHADYAKGKQEEGLHGLALMFGAYVGAVITKDIGRGRWEREHPDFGADAFPFYYAESACWFPVSWCHKRIIDGKGDDIVFKYRVLVTERLSEGDS
jgi:hypothetical protein